MPKATNAAERSSEMVLQWMSGCLTNAKVKGAHLEPGERMAFLIPFLAKIAAKSIIGWIIKLILLNEFSDNVTF